MFPEISFLNLVLLGMASKVDILKTMGKNSLTITVIITLNNIIRDINT